MFNTRFLKVIFMSKINFELYLIPKVKLKIPDNS